MLLRWDAANLSPQRSTANNENKLFPQRVFIISSECFHTDNIRHFRGSLFVDDCLFIPATPRSISHFSDLTLELTSDISA